jgi:hypothetical protein
MFLQWNELALRIRQRDVFWLRHGQPERTVVCSVESANNIGKLERRPEHEYALMKVLLNRYSECQTKIAPSR